MGNSQQQILAALNKDHIFATLQHIPEPRKNGNLFEPILVKQLGEKYIKSQHPEANLPNESQYHTLKLKLTPPPQLFAEKDKKDESELIKTEKFVLEGKQPVIIIEYKTKTVKLVKLEKIHLPSPPLPPPPAKGESSSKGEATAKFNPTPKPNPEPVVEDKHSKEGNNKWLQQESSNNKRKLEDQKSEEHRQNVSQAAKLNTPTPSPLLSRPSPLSESIMSFFNPRKTPVPRPNQLQPELQTLNLLKPNQLQPELQTLNLLKPNQLQPELQTLNLLKPPQQIVPHLWQTNAPASNLVAMSLFKTSSHKSQMEKAFEASDQQKEQHVSEKAATQSAAMSPSATTACSA